MIVPYWGCIDCEYDTFTEQDARGHIRQTGHRIDDPLELELEVTSIDEIPNRFARRVMRRHENIMFLLEHSRCSRGEIASRLGIEPITLDRWVVQYGSPELREMFYKLPQEESAKAPQYRKTG